MNKFSETKERKNFFDSKFLGMFFEGKNDFSCPESPRIQTNNEIGSLEYKKNIVIENKFETDERPKNISSKSELKNISQITKKNLKLMKTLDSKIGNTFKENLKYSKKFKTSEFKNMYFHPILMNNLQIFFKKIRKWSYLGDFSQTLKPFDLKVIDDKTYFEKEESIKSSKSVLIFMAFQECFIKISSLILGLLRLKNNYKFIFHPYNRFKLIWDLLNSAFIILMLFYLPLNFCFDVEIEETNMKIFYVIFLALDIFIEMNTSYFKNGTEVINKKKIVINYFSTSFTTDIIAFIAIINQILEMSELKIVNLVFFTKIFTLVRIGKSFNNRFQLHYKMKGIKDLILFFFFIILVTHVIACGWYFISLKSSIGKNCWIHSKEIINENWQIKYLNSFYWSIVSIMTVGYGDITPVNNTEKIYSIFVILFGCMILPYSINCIGIVIQSMNKNENQFQFLFF